MNKKKVSIIFLLLFIFSLSTYAIYKVGGKSVFGLNTAKWNVKVKEKELKTAGTVDLNFTKDDIVWEPNPKVKEGTIAPGSKGSITFNVDATGTEVSTDVLVDITKTSDNPNISVTTDNDYGFINVNDNNKVITITINIEWLKRDDYELDNLDINKLFDIEVKVTVKQSFGERKTLNQIILNNYGGKDTIKAKGTPDFSKIATSNEGMFMTEDDDGESYYYRGSANNWVDFAGFYWRIIRINGDGSIRMIYSGTKDNHRGYGMKIGDSIYNSKNDSPLSLDYRTSTTKIYIEEWYKNNILNKGYDNKIVDAGFCNDMKMIDENNFNSYERNIINKSPSLKCPRITDLLKQNNNTLTYPIGLITLDEASFAGGKYSSANINYYLYSGFYYRTMTPINYNYNASLAEITNNGNIVQRPVSFTEGVRPVLSLKSDVIISTGDGTLNSPYVVK